MGGLDWIGFTALPVPAQRNARQGRWKSPSKQIKPLARHWPSCAPPFEKTLAQKCMATSACHGGLREGGEEGQCAVGSAQTGGGLIEWMETKETSKAPWPRELRQGGKGGSQALQQYGKSYQHQPEVKKPYAHSQHEVGRTRWGARHSSALAIGGGLSLSPACD
jgi:hypothetical protein